MPAEHCYVLDREQCTEAQWETVMNGTALIKNWIVVDANTSYLFPELVGNGTSPGNGTTSPTPSGSTAPPESTGASSRLAGNALLAVVIAALVVIY